MLPRSPIPAPGFTLISGKRNPPDNGTNYMVQYRSGYVDKWTYSARQMVWIHTGSSWDIVAVKEASK